MSIQDTIKKNIQRLKDDAESLNAKADELSRLLPLVGVSAAIIGDGHDDDDYYIVKVGDEVFSKYGDIGIVEGFKNIDAENWYEVRVMVKSQDGTVQEFNADRLN